MGDDGYDVLIRRLQDARHERDSARRVATQLASMLARRKDVCQDLVRTALRYPRHGDTSCPNPMGRCGGLDTCDFHSMPNGGEYCIS